MNYKEFLELLCCPACKRQLAQQRQGTELYCAACKFTFPIVDGIPMLFPCDVKVQMKDMFQRYWDSEDKAELYDKHVEGAGTIFGVYNHVSELYGLTVFYDKNNLDLLLDAGCGNGRFLETLPNETVAIGADASLNLLRIAQKKGRGSFHVCCELEHLPFRDGTFSTVISCRVLQHIRAQELAVRELCRVTRDRGDVILELYNRWNLKTLYKNIRMSKHRKIFNFPFNLVFRSMSPFAEWVLTYDKYSSWREVKRWVTGNGLRAVKGRGVGFGYHKYLFEPFFIDAVLAKYFPGFLKSYYDKCFAVERAFGGLFPFRYLMEKFVIRARKDSSEPKRGLLSKVVGRLDYSLKSSVLWNVAALKERRREKRHQAVVIRENRFHIQEAVDWIKRAHDATPDGGVSRGYSVGWNHFFKGRGWQPSYPETTGYIIPTMFDCAEYLADQDLRKRAVAMADWQIQVQMSSGAVMGGTVDSKPSPAVFNTGQVMLGWLRAYEETREKRYLDACQKAGEFLVSVQDRDGGWYKGNSQFANAKTTTYNSRVGWALILSGQRFHNDKFVEAGDRNIQYSIGQQTSNGWFRNNCLDDANASLLHTICYAIEGIFGAADALRNQEYFERAKLSADHLLQCLRQDGSLPGRLDSSWKGTVEWSCLTGDAQLAGIWLGLFGGIGEIKYRTAAREILQFLKRTQNCISSDRGLRGGLKGSYPFDGAYGRYEVLNWATKFYLDALLLDEKYSS